MLKSLLQYLARRSGRKRLPHGLGAGDLCSIESGEEGSFGIAKVLARADGIVHVRLYKEKFGWRPQRITSDELSLGTIHDDNFGIGHLPLDEGVFGQWNPQVICREAISEEELEGFREWQESGGGAWK